MGEFGLLFPDISTKSIRASTETNRIELYVEVSFKNVLIENVLERARATVGTIAEKPDS